ncbi:(2R)-phospho-3-sulfolactate synthase (ComA) [Geosmithia morbida]|uniref:(2R)-phospho-3-sulfolactate synthase (ComA) n=1 Tax=Geosmithia morbida TaxID=1094350 RepID=A0A9P4YTZ6_9HYPO|nr:(2R)-phospho-3-sulfolactate synthase (ComA) [Geosmithia morbida]KAF4122035.1 (2R)-phospho-3-sulfolactate synthase (ComA) [Geosmithia morbida]
MTAAATRGAVLGRALTHPSGIVRSAASQIRPFSQSFRSRSQGPKILLEDADQGFGFVRHNARPPKPRKVGVTEIRGPYYSAMGKRYLADVLETMGHHVDGVKFAGGSFSLFPEDKLRELIDLAHKHDVYVSTGGWMEHVLTQSSPVAAVDRYLAKCKDLGFDVIEISTGFLSLPQDDWVRLVERTQAAGLKPKPECGIQFGAGGDTDAAALSSMGGTSDPSRIIDMGRHFVDMGVERIMIESEGITENVTSWRTDVIQKILRELPLDKVMFEAADPQVFNWYIREFGTDINVFVDHSQIVQLSCLREGIWGMADTFGKVTSFR